jgi:F-type H+-transporting ATPase subunit epsilon
MATISFDLVSPENLIFNDEVGMVIVPGKDGDLGILPGHSKVMSSLRPGRVMVYGEGKNLLKSFFVSGGFAEINPEKCIVLAESVNEINTLEKLVIEKEIQDLEGQETDKAKEQINVAKEKISALDSNFYEKI